MLANDLLAMAFGFLWGWGAVTFAMAINAVGLSLGYAIIMGINTAVGSIIPMIRRWGEVPADARTSPWQGSWSALWESRSAAEPVYCERARIPNRAVIPVLRSLRIWA